jgi:hypothetical protein
MSSVALSLHQDRSPQILLQGPLGGPKPSAQIGQGDLDGLRNGLVAHHRHELLRRISGSREVGSLTATVPLEQLASALYLDNRKDVDFYFDAVNRLFVEAAPLKDTIRILSRIVDNLDKTPE